MSTATNARSVGYRERKRAETGDIPKSTSHAELRWLSRGGDFAMSLSQAWEEAVPVGYDGAGRARLHPPTDTILISARGVIKTVLVASLASYRADHLVTCKECDLEYQRLPDEIDCPWCAYTEQEVQL